MATFYVLPPRDRLEAQLAAMLGKLLPGLPIPVDSWDAVVERIAETAGWPDDVYIIPRDEIPFGESVENSLVESFGAEPGDRIIEVSASGTRNWTLPGVSVPLLAR